MKISRIISVVLILLLIATVIGFLYLQGYIKTDSFVWGGVLYVLSLPAAFLIKLLRTRKPQPLIDYPATYAQHKKAREAEIKRLEEDIERRKREIQAIEAAQKAQEENKNDLTLSDKEKWGQELLNKTIKRRDLSGVLE